MGSWKSGRMERSKDGRVKRWKDGKGERRKDGKVGRWKDGKVEGWKGGRMGRWRDGKICRLVLQPSPPGIQMTTLVFRIFACV